MGDSRQSRVGGGGRAKVNDFLEGRLDMNITYFQHERSFSEDKMTQIGQCREDRWARGTP